MTTAAEPAPGSDPPFFIAPGTNLRRDEQTTKIAEGFGTVSKLVDGKTVYDRDALAAGLAEMTRITERIEAAIDRGVQVKTVDDAGNIVTGTPVKTRTVEEIMERVRRFYSPNGPTFISPPIDGYVYVARVPRLADQIDADTEASKQGGDQATQNFTKQFSLVLHCLYGRIAESRTADLALIKAMPGDVEKWFGVLEPQSHVVSAIMNDRNPGALDDVVRPLLTAWWTWFVDVTPTGDELKKYRALAGTATNS